MRIIFLMFLLIISSFAYSETNLSSDKLQKIADDMKFQNGAHFVALQKYRKAIQEFQEYLEIYPNGIHRHEVYLALANIHFSRFDYYKAIRIYKSLYEEYSTQDEGIYAIYTIGICYKKMGYASKAEQVFKDILKNHPSSHYAYKAKLQLDLSQLIN